MKCVTVAPLKKPDELVHCIMYTVPNGKWRQKLRNRPNKRTTNSTHLRSLSQAERPPTFRLLTAPTRHITSTKHCALVGSMNSNKYEGFNCILYFIVYVDGLGRCKTYKIAMTNINFINQVKK